MPLGPPNLAPVVNAFAFPCVRRRYAGPTRSSAAGSAGLVVRGAPTDTAITAHVWDDTGENAEALPEGQRKAREIHGCTTFDVRSVDDVAGLPADDLVYDGSSFEIYAANPWAAGPTGARSFIEFHARKVVR